jgi:opacity protein-like surface antigen
MLIPKLLEGLGSSEMLSLRLGAAPATLALFMMTAPVFAADPVPPAADWYVSVFGGAAFSQDIDYDLFQSGVQAYDGHQELDTGFLVGGAIGTRLWDAVRAEIEVSYQRNKAGDVLYDNPGNYPYDGNGYSDAIYVLGNAWYDIPVSEDIVPYLGGGAGIAFVKQDIDQPDDTFGPSGRDSGFAFQLGGGVGFSLTDNIVLDVGYRFRGILNVDIAGQQIGDDHNNQDIYSHTVLATLRFEF